MWKLMAHLAQNVNKQPLSPTKYSSNMTKLLREMYHTEQNKVIQLLLHDKFVDCDCTGAALNTYSLNRQGYLSIKVSNNLGGTQWEQLSHESFMKVLRDRFLDVYDKKDVYCTTEMFDCCLIIVILRTAAAAAVKKSTQRCLSTHLEAIAHFGVLLMLLYRHAKVISDFTLNGFESRNKDKLSEICQYMIQQAKGDKMEYADVLQSPLAQAERERTMSFTSIVFKSEQVLCGNDCSCTFCRCVNVVSQDEEFHSPVSGVCG
mmetsp:Transcript_33176/g.47998  ORF Transcript_33176/g.47998 Transcript_33176/m.47998 type:complete len:261 (+) Transcript_33176:213-995(+)